jgi:N-glycosylase/DNA lyase
MNNLIKQISKLKKSKIRQAVQKRMNEFEKAGRQPSKFIFGELCFCLLTANFNAARAIEIQNSVGKHFHSLSEKLLAKKLKKSGHRFPNARAHFISEARIHKPLLKSNLNPKDEAKTRDWLVKNIKGLGMKEASHFLRNIGFKNLAIIDFHIIDLLARNSLIKKPKSKSLTRNNYLEIEKTLKTLAKRVNLNLSELDLYLWYMETGKILK